VFDFRLTFIFITGYKCNDSVNELPDKELQMNSNQIYNLEKTLFYIFEEILYCNTCENLCNNFKQHILNYVLIIFYLDFCIYFERLVFCERTYIKFIMLKNKINLISNLLHIFKNIVGQVRDILKWIWLSTLSS